MGMFRCPRCDSICHTGEDVCHVCGYIFPASVGEKKQEEKVEDTKKEEVKKEERPVFSRSSVLNSVSFDKKEDKSLREEDPFAAFDFDNDVKLDDPLKDFDLDNETKVELPLPSPTIEKEVKIEEHSTSSDDIAKEPILPNKEIKVEVEKPKVEPTKEVKKVEEAKKVAPTPTTSVEEKVVSSKVSNVKLPDWVIYHQNKPDKDFKKGMIASAIFSVIFIIFLILLGVDKEKKWHEGYHGRYFEEPGYYTSEVKGVYVFFSFLFGFALLVAIIYALSSKFTKVQVAKIDNYFAVVTGCNTIWRFYIENKEVDSYSSRRYSNPSKIFLKGKLPSGKIAVAEITRTPYENKITFSVKENIKQRK
ncbi:MAG: hypothetical protein K6E21_01010 [Bacilli bacterium]|nr:hypothetical protein [Bacilli bacterium]